MTYDGMPIDGISTSTGKAIPIFTANNKILPNMNFDSIAQVEQFLYNILLETLNSPDDQYTKVSKFGIGTISVKMDILPTEHTGYDKVLNNLLKGSTGNVLTKRYIGNILLKCVREGFRTTLPQMHMKIFEIPEISDILEKNVPFFVQENIERFMDVGINACTPDEIAGIILTSTDEQLTAIQIDSLNNVSK
jgi:hypothetical protein